MSSDFNFTSTSWFLGNVHMKLYFNTQWGKIMPTTLQLASPPWIFRPSYNPGVCSAMMHFHNLNLIKFALLHRTVFLLVLLFALQSHTICNIFYKIKGQLISKCLFEVSSTPQKNERKNSTLLLWYGTSSRIVFVCFLG